MFKEANPCKGRHLSINPPECKNLNMNSVAMLPFSRRRQKPFARNSSVGTHLNSETTELKAYNCKGDGEEHDTFPRLAEHSCQNHILKTAMQQSMAHKVQHPSKHPGGFFGTSYQRDRRLDGVVVRKTRRLVLVNELLAGACTRKKPRLLLVNES